MAASITNAEDLRLIKEAIIFPYLNSTLEHDIKLMMSSNLKMKELYARQLRKLQNSATMANYEIRKQMRSLGIKLIAEHREKERFVTEYMVRGYTGEFQMLYSFLKVEIQDRLAQLMQLDLGDKSTDP